MTGYERRAAAGGVEALREALLDLEVALRIYVPGYPVTDAVPALGGGAWMATNEKVAMEVALGASASGRRSVVLVKHLGVNLLSDPLSIAPSHSIGAGLVVLAGEDVGPKGSQAEMDTRNYGPLCEIPVLEPSGPGLLFTALEEAYALSEEIRAPAMVRTTFEFAGGDAGSGISSTDNSVNPDKREAGMFGTFDRSIWDLTAKGRHQRYRGAALPRMRSASEGSSLNLLREGAGDLGIIACGRPASFASKTDHPLPAEAIREFVSEHDKILVAEEPAPFIEARLEFCGDIFGKLTGHLPWGRMEEGDIERAADLIASGEEPGPAAPPQRFDEQLASKTVCDDCPYLPLYEAVADLPVPVAGDAGCSIRAVRDPPGAVDVAYGLGSSVAVACGFGEKGVALIGDYALAHSGLLGLIDAVNNEREVLVVLLNNGVAAMTGGQSVPDISPVMRAIVPELRTVDLPAGRDEIVELLSLEMARPGVSLVVARGACPRFAPPR
ncbi:MAG: thiamine pyrophosphate-dependent enzyme [Methanothrix sp.]